MPVDPQSFLAAALGSSAPPPGPPEDEPTAPPSYGIDPQSFLQAALAPSEPEATFLEPPVPGVAEGIEAATPFGDGSRSQPTFLEQLGGVGRAVTTGAQQLLGGVGTAMETAGEAMQRPGIVGGPLLAGLGLPLEAVGETLAQGSERYMANAQPAEIERQQMAEQSPGWGFAQDVGAQVPQLLAAAASGGGAPALGVLGASAAGQGIQQAEMAGATPEEAVAYGATSGVIEAATERFGKIPVVDKILKRAITGTVVKGGALKRIMKDVGANFGEEVVASVGQRIAALNTYDDQGNFSAQDVSEALYSGLVGAFVAGVPSAAAEIGRQAPPPQAPPPAMPTPATPEPIQVPIVEPLPPQPEVVPQAPVAAPVAPEPQPVVQTVVEAPPPPPAPTPKKRKAGPSPEELDQLQAPAPQPSAPQAAQPEEIRPSSALVERDYDTRKPPYERDDDNSYVTRHVATPVGDVLEGIHVTDDPAPVIRTLKAGKPIAAGRGGNDVGDLGGGLYFSEAPELWESRSRGKWAFLPTLDAGQKKRLADELLTRVEKQESTRYISKGEADGARRTVRDWLSGAISIDSITDLAGQPYNEKFWDPEFLKPLGISPGKTPKRVPIKVRGKFAKLARNPVQSEVEALRKAGYDGAFTTGGMSTTPQFVVWNNDAVVQFGDYSRQEAQNAQGPEAAQADSGERVQTGPAEALSQGSEGAQRPAREEAVLAPAPTPPVPGAVPEAVAPGKQPWQMSRWDYAESAKKNVLPDWFETLDSLSKKNERRPYNPDVLDEDRVAVLQKQGFLSGRKNFKLTDEARTKLRELRDLEKENTFAYGDASDQHFEHVLKAVQDGKNVPKEVLDEYPEWAENFAKARSGVKFRTDPATKPSPRPPKGEGLLAGTAAPVSVPRPVLSEATPEDAAKLVNAAQTFPGPIGEKVQELGEPSAAKSFVQRWFTSRRGLPASAKKAIESREGDIASTRAVAKDLGQSLDSAIFSHVKALAAHEQEVTGVKPDLDEIQDQVWAKANAVLDGVTSPKESNLPKPILDRLRIFREEIDKGSQSIAAEEGMISDEMKEVFGENVGKYVTRSYLVHQIGGERRIKQLKRGGQAEWNDVRDEIAAMDEFQGWDTDQIEGWMENELARFEPGRPTQESEGKPPGTQNLAIYKHRKDIPDPIRKLYGEIKNPAVRAFVTVTNIRRNLDTFRMYKAIREGGLKEGWLSETEKPGFRAVEGSKATAPLQSRRSKKKGTEEAPGGPPRDSLFGRKDILDTLQSADFSVRIPVVSWITGAIKSAKTVYSVQAQVRNIMANPLLLLGGGNLGWAPWKRASITGSLREATREFKRGSRADAFADLSNVDMKDLAGAWGRAGNLGVTNTNPDLADIRAMMGVQLDPGLPPAHRPLSAKELLSADPAQMLGVQRGLKFVSEKMQTSYRLGDEFFKFVAWQNETAKIRYYRPELSQDQAEVLAADIVRDILPTDQRAPQFLRLVRQFPVLGTFVSFVSEIPRNAKNIVVLGVKEVREGKASGNKRQMEVGFHRLGSFVLASSAISGIAAAIKAATPGDDEEKDKLESAARVFLPFYAKNQTLAVVKGARGKATAFDLSFMDPWAVLKDPIVTFFRTGALDEKDLDDRLAAATREALDPYISEGLGLGLMFDLLRGRNSRGIELWDPALPADEKRRAMATYALRGIEPGTLTTARRIGYGVASKIDKAQGGEGVKDPVNRREYDPVTELFAIAGMRPLPIDATTQLGFTARSYSDLTGRAASQFRKESRASADPEKRPQAEENYRYIYDKGMKELASGVAAARAFGLTDDEIAAILKDNRISAAVREKAMSPEEAVLKTMTELREERLKEIEDEVDQERAARKEAAAQ